MLIFFQSFLGVVSDNSIHVISSSKLLVSLCHIELFVDLLLHTSRLVVRYPTRSRVTLEKPAEASVMGSVMAMSWLCHG